MTCGGSGRARRALVLGGYADDAAVETQILKVEIASYISLRESMSLRDELVENEQTC